MLVTPFGPWVMSSREIATFAQIESFYFIDPADIPIWEEVRNDEIITLDELANTKTRGRCWYCARKATTIDHLVPRIRGGDDDWHNLYPACRSCNSQKGIRPFGLFRQIFSCGVVVPNGFLPLFYGEWTLLQPRLVRRPSRGFPRRIVEVSEATV